MRVDFEVLNGRWAMVLTADSGADRVALAAFLAPATAHSLPPSATAGGVSGGRLAFAATTPPAEHGAERGVGHVRLVPAPGGE